MRRKIVIAYFLLAIISVSLMLQITAESTEKGGLFPTSKESTVRLNVTLDHDGLDSEKGLPTLSVNKTYTLKIEIGVVELGKDAEDIHDIAIRTEISKSNIFGSKTYYHTGLYTDKDTKLVAGQNATIKVQIMPVGTGERITGAELSVIVSVKEAVSLNIDPTTEFTPFKYSLVLNPEEKTNVISSYDDGDTVKRSVVALASKESQINFTLVVGVDTINNDTNKPEISTYKKYSLYFYFEVISLGPDADDVHDIDISIFLEDESVKDYFPGSDTRNYFAMNLASNQSMGEGDSIELYSVFFVSSNSNDTTVKFRTIVQVKEAVSLFPDPTSKIADFSIEMRLNPDSSTNLSESPVFLAPFIIVMLALPVVLKKRRQRI